MKNILFIICTFAILTAGLVSAAHAHVEKQDTNQQIELNINQDNIDTDVTSDPLCDMHCHNHMSFNSSSQPNTVQSTKKHVFLIYSDLKSSIIHGFKRPPKS